jgi:hypothetical protein
MDFWFENIPIWQPCSEPGKGQSMSAHCINTIEINDLEGKCTNIKMDEIISKVGKDQYTSADGHYHLQMRKKQVTKNYLSSQFHLIYIYF